MAYHLKLTESEMETLAWMGARWSAPSKLWESLTPEIEHPDGTVTYRISEPDAWEINELSESTDDGFVCLNWSSNLGEKILAFLNSIV